MGAMLNGMSLYGGLIPYGGTFFVFLDYMRPAVRLSALMRQPVIYVFTHDSIFLGEDGPTHEPVEHLMSLRGLPGLTTIRPADATETTVAWVIALENREGPTALLLTRQNLPVLDRRDLAPESAKRFEPLLRGEQDLLLGRLDGWSGRLGGVLAAGGEREQAEDQGQAGLHGCLQLG